MRQGAFNDEELVGMHEGFVIEHAPEALDLVLGPMGEIGQGAFVYAGALAAACTQEDGWGRVAVGDGFNLTGNITVCPRAPSVGKQMAYDNFLGVK